MKKNIPIISLLSLSVFALVSCEQPARVVDRPLGHNPVYPVGDSVAPPLRDGSNIMDDIRNQSTIGMPEINPNAGTAPGGTTLSNMIDANKPPVPNTAGNNAAANVPGNTSGMGVAPVLPKQPDIPYAWPDPSDPNVVRSPYDRTLKIRITKPDGTRYSSGTIMWDPNFKAEKKQFRVP